MPFGEISATTRDGGPRMIRIKRIYDPPAASDGARILIDRLWPRGISRERAALTEWRRELAPSDGLREWYGHLPERFARFRERYRMELLRDPDALAELALRSESAPLTLLYAARDGPRSNAAVLAELLAEAANGAGTRGRRARPVRSRATAVAQPRPHAPPRKR